MNQHFKSLRTFHTSFFRPKSIMSSCLILLVLITTMQMKLQLNFKKHITILRTLFLAVRLRMRIRLFFQGKKVCLISTLIFPAFLNLILYSMNPLEKGNENDGDEYTDAPTTPSPSQGKRNTKSDRSRIINSERKRRGTMKEKLYQLRALVPNITKMDRASIIADAVKYVQDLQMKAKALKTEIESMESSDEGNINQPESIHNPDEPKLSENLVSKKIMQIEVVRIEETEFHVKLVCQNGLGVAGSLIKALELLSGFTLQSSNLAYEAEDYILRFNIEVSESKVDFNLSNLRFQIETTFSSEGFDIEKSLSAEAANCSG
ncbi:hypothetical protein Leryth_013882 [Lithospermum erythrorhizon]|nr:hypothetical protein Leryth_013882 [Lithospermum erythrorhizon]